MRPTEKESAEHKRALQLHFSPQSQTMKPMDHFMGDLFDRKFSVEIDVPSPLFTTPHIHIPLTSLPPRRFLFFCFHRRSR